MSGDSKSGVGTEELNFVLSKIEDCSDLVLIEPLFPGEIDWDKHWFDGASKAIEYLEAAIDGSESAYSNLVKFDPENDSRAVYTDRIYKIVHSFCSIVLERELTEQEQEELIKSVVKDFVHDDPIVNIYPIIKVLRQISLQFFDVDVTEDHSNMNPKHSRPFKLSQLSRQPAIVYNPYANRLMICLPIPIGIPDTRGLLLLGDTELENYEKDYGIVRLRQDPWLISN
jgi:hypothetical protein